MSTDTVGAVLVCGAGIAGIQSSLDLAESGFKVYLLDSAPAIGGRMAQLNRTFPTGDCAMCVLSPKLVECARNRNIEIITLADVTDVSGRPGNFKVKIRRNPRYIDLKKCDACGDCAAVCPVSLPNEFDPGMGMRKAAFQPYPQAIPNVFTISKAAGQAPCKASCPAGVNVPGFVALAAAGKLVDSYELIRRRSILPASCGRVCPQPCRSGCNRKEIEGAVSIGNLERFVGDFIHANPDQYPAFEPAGNGTEGRVAVIGAGPAGLTAAADLTLKGYDVTLFESKLHLGGMLRYGIPDYRLPKDVLDKEIRHILDLGIEVRTGTRIARPGDLLISKRDGNGEADSRRNEDGYHAVFVATGAWTTRKLGIPGEDAEGVLEGLSFLHDVNVGHPPDVGPRVLVIGSADLALDAARCARRLQGVESVQMACLEGSAEMPDHSGQTAEAAAEGVVMNYGLGPTRIQATKGKVTSVAFRSCTSAYDRYGKLNPIFDDSKVTVLPADTVVIAAGRGVDSSRPGMERRPGGRILADSETLATAIEGIFAGGDAVTGPASMADAMAHGHKAAESIDAFLRGNARIRSTDEMTVAPAISPNAGPTVPAPGPIPNALRRDPVRMPQTGAPGSLEVMAEVNLGYSREQAELESQRCLSCALCCECMQCVKACSAEAVVHDERPAELDLEVGGIILAPETESSSSTMTPEGRLGLNADAFGEFGFDRAETSPPAASRPGIYVAGAFQEPKDIPDSVAQGSAAAAGAMEQLTAVRGTMIQRREYPWERDVADESPRVGVFICHCGHNISSVVDVDRLAAEAAGMPGVFHAEANAYTCSEANQQHIREMIHRHRLNRLVVASCSSRTHEVLFQQTLRESGLNQYLFAMTNIRDECAWVHRDDPGAATDKAAALVSMAVARARHLHALPLTELPVTASALIIGGGLAGMTAAQNIAGQGFEVHLVEREPLLGGMLRGIHATLEQADVPAYLKQLVDRTRRHPKIKVHLNAELVRITGQVGNFTSILNAAGTETVVKHGAVIVATGGKKRQTEQFFHGRNSTVVTQSSLEAMLASGGPLPQLEAKQNPAVVMIQCVESRDDANPYCSRVCCAEAVKNALEIKRRLPDSDVVILGSDIQAYGLRERYHQKAVSQGIRFIRYPEDNRPEAAEEEGRLRVKVYDTSSARALEFHPDLLVLSTGISPAAGNPELSGMLRSALTADGFFQEAHPKLCPVDLPNEGEFICGAAHSPRFMDETIAQAQAAAARASTILSKTRLEILGQVATVHPAGCVACATCVKICPYGAPMINDLRKAEIQGAKCVGCGSCVASCPARTITLQHQESETMAAMLDELLAGGGSV